jgi:hypothetical protein
LEVPLVFQSHLVRTIHSEFTRLFQSLQLYRLQWAPDR